MCFVLRVCVTALKKSVDGLKAFVDLLGQSASSKQFVAAFVRLVVSSQEWNDIEELRSSLSQLLQVELNSLDAQSPALKAADLPVVHQLVHELRLQLALQCVPGSTSNLPLVVFLLSLFVDVVESRPATSSAANVFFPPAVVAPCFNLLTRSTLLTGDEDVVTHFVRCTTRLVSLPNVELKSTFSDDLKEILQAAYSAGSQSQNFGPLFGGLLELQLALFRNKHRITVSLVDEKKCTCLSRSSLLSLMPFVLLALIFVVMCCVWQWRRRRRSRRRRTRN